MELREQFAVKQPAIVDLAFVLKCFGHLDEIVLLSTCNRVEIYGTTRKATRHIKSLLQLLCAEPRDLDQHIYLYEGAAAVRHLLRVAAGLDSMVLGETEITGQIKNAYEIARNAGLTGRVLNRLFQKAFQAAKEVRTAHRDRARHRFNQEHGSGIDWKDAICRSNRSWYSAPARWRRVAFVFWSKKARNRFLFRVVRLTARSISPRAAAEKRSASVIAFLKCAMSMLSSLRQAALRYY